MYYYTCTFYYTHYRLFRFLTDSSFSRKTMHLKKYIHKIDENLYNYIHIKVNIDNFLLQLFNICYNMLKSDVTAFIENHCFIVFQSFLYFL